MARRVRVRRRRLTLVAGLVLVIGLGVAVLMFSQEPETVRAATSGAVEVEFTDEWRQESGGDGFDGLEFQASPVALTSDGGGRNVPATSVRAGRIINARGASDPLPSGLRERFPEGFRRDLVEIAGTPWFRYRSRSPGGQEDEGLTLLLAATDRGYQGLACQGLEKELASADGPCSRIASTLRLVEASALPLGPDESFASFLVKMLGRLEAAERKAAPGFSADSAQRQEKSARLMARAFRGAARDLAKFEVLPQDRVAKGRVLRALRDLADAYSKLASAAAAEDPARFDEARRLVERGADAFRSGRKALVANGYRFVDSSQGDSGKKK